MAKAKKTMFKVGDVVKVVKNAANHGFPVGTAAKVTAVYPAQGTIQIEGGTSYLYCADVVFGTVSLDDLKDEKKDLQKQLARVEEKLAFLAETGEDSFDPEILRCYSILRTLDSSSSDIEKAKKITSIFRD